jgi:hypothetical protein
MSRPEQGVKGRRSLVRRLLTGGAVAGPLFIGTFLAEGATREGYNPVRHPVSSLALGPRGWRQTANFSVAGVLYLGFATGMALLRDNQKDGTDDKSAATEGTRDNGTTTSRVGPVLLGASALGLLGSAAFVTDPVSGYPPGTPDALTERTTTGGLHDLSAVPVFLGLPAAQLIYARAFYRAGRPGWAAYSVGSAAVMVSGMVLASSGFAQVPRWVRFGGLFQRLAVVSGLGWQTALAVQSLRAADPKQP